MSFGVYHCKYSWLTICVKVSSRCWYGWLLFCRKLDRIFWGLDRGDFFHWELECQHPRLTMCRIYDLNISVSAVVIMHNIFESSENNGGRCKVCYPDLVFAPLGRVLLVAPFLELNIHRKSCGLPWGPKWVTAFNTVKISELGWSNSTEIPSMDTLLLYK